MKKSFNILVTLCVLTVLTSNVAFADFKEHYDLGQTYLTQYQYSGAITEFKNALRINYMDNSARIGLINSYLARAHDYANKDKNWEKAANDYRSALFYLVYYSSQSAAQNSATAINQVNVNLDKCLSMLDFNYEPESRYALAKQLRAEGNFPAAAYEFNQSLGSRSLQKNSFEQTADIMKLLGNEPKASEFYKKALAVDPSDINTRLEYAKILDSIGDSEAAMKEYSYVLEKTTSANKDVLYALERTFKKKLNDSPNNANLNANMGAIYQKEGDFDTALSYYKQAEALDPKNIDTRINTGTLYQQKEDYKTAIKAYESVLILYPDNVKALLYRAQCYAKLGDDKVAQEGYKKVLELDPNNDLVLSQMLDSVKNTMTKQQFIDYVHTTFTGSDTADIFYDYALDLHKQNKLDDAIVMYNAAIKDNSKNSEMFVNLALAQAQQNKYESALETLKLAKTNFPTDENVSKTITTITNMKTDSLLTSASDAYKAKNYKDAIKYYASVIPATADTMLGIASAYEELGNKDKAIEFYKKSLEIKPINSDVAYAIACLYGEKEDWTNTKEYLGKAIAYNKNNTQAIEYLQSINQMLDENEKTNLLNDAIALYDSNDYENSLVKFNELLKKDAQNSYALYYRGMIYDAKENRTSAISDFKQAYALNKDFEICNYLIAVDYDTMEKYKDAYNYYLAYANSNAQDDEYKKYAKDRAAELKEYATK